VVTEKFVLGCPEKLEFVHLNLRLSVSCLFDEIIVVC